MTYPPEILEAQKRRLIEASYNSDPEWREYFADQERRWKDWETRKEGVMRKYRIKINYKFLGLFNRSTEIEYEYYDMQSARVLALAVFEKKHPFAFEAEVVSSIEFK